MKTFGVIDIGTNTILCLKASIINHEINIISDSRFHYRAGKRLDEVGNISSQYKTGMKNAVSKALEIVKDCSDVKITATEVLRKPKDGHEFAAKLSDEINIPIEIIDSQKEAELSFRGAVYQLEDIEGTVGVLDVGGGSTELAVGSGKRLLDWTGVKLGAVSICELAGYGKPVDDYLSLADRTFMESDFSKLLKNIPDRMIVVGGTAVSVAAILAQLEEFNPEKLNDFVLLESVLALLLETLALTPAKKLRKLMAFDPERADIIVGGGAILLSFMRKYGFNEIQVSINGLRHGLLLEHFG